MSLWEFRRVYRLRALHALASDYCAKPRHVTSRALRSKCHAHYVDWSSSGCHQVQLSQVRLRTLTLAVSILPLISSAKLPMPLLALRAGRALRRPTLFTPLTLLLTVITLLPISCAKLLTVLLMFSTFLLLSYVMFDAHADSHQHSRPKQY
jgi:hypothetical protein